MAAAGIVSPIGMLDRPAPPSVEEVWQFVKRLTRRAHFPAHVIVLALIYIGRLQVSTLWPLLPTTWRATVLIAVLISQKTWDDVSIGNADFPRIWKAACNGPQDLVDSMTVSTVNQLELVMLTAIEFNLAVTASAYARFYFELHVLVTSGNPHRTVQPLTPEQAEKLELRSSVLGVQLRSTTSGRHTAGHHAAAAAAIRRASASAAAATAATAAAAAAGTTTRAAAAAAAAPATSPSPVHKSRTAESARRYTQASRAARHVLS